jgi:protein tyrosine/serine phosphatase
MSPGTCTEMLYRFRQVAPTLFRGSAPTIQDLEWLKNSLGIRKIVSLDQVAGHKIDRACKLLGLNHVKLYINGDRASLMRALHHNLKKLLLEDGPTYIHCHHGKDRTGLLVALLQCKYLGMDPERAIQEAKSLGFGIGLDPKTTHLYEKLIRHCKPSQDTNSADIVSNEREYKGDNRDTFLDESRQDSFAPFLDHTKQAPADFVFNYIMEQSPTRQNYSDKSIKEHDMQEDDAVPQVGTYDNDAGVKGFGPSENNGGFIYD